MQSHLTASLSMRISPFFFLQEHVIAIIFLSSLRVLEIGLLNFPRRILRIIIQPPLLHL